MSCGFTAHGPGVVARAHTVHRPSTCSIIACGPGVASSPEAVLLATDTLRVLA